MSAMTASSGILTTPQLAPAITNSLEFQIGEPSVAPVSQEVEEEQHSSGRRERL